MSLGRSKIWIWIISSFLLSCYTNKKESLGFGWRTIDPQSNAVLSYEIPHLKSPDEGENYIVLRHNLVSTDKWTSPSLLLSNLAPVVRVKFRDQVLYDVKNPKRETPIIPLPILDSEVELELHLKAVLTFPMNLMEAPIILEEEEAERILLARHQSYSGLGFFFLTVSFFSYYLYFRRRKKQTLSFGLYAGLFGLHFFSYVGFFGWSLTEDLRVALLLHYLSLFLLPIAGLIFFERIFELKSFSLVNLFWKFLLAFDVAFVILNFSNIISFAMTIRIFTWIALPVLLIQVGIIWNEILQKRIKSWVLAFGSIFILLTAGHDILMSLNIITSAEKYSQWGIFFFVLSLSIYGEKRFRDSEIKFASLQKDIVTASRMQHAILPPKLPDWPGLGIVNFYKTSDEVGGDFYEFQSLGEDGYSILIADVAGHGLGASIIASLGKIAFFQGFKFWNNPKELLTYMNENLIEKSQGRFTTANYFLMNKAKSSYVISGAGHPSYFHYKHKSKAIEEIKPPGKPLGISSKFIFSNFEGIVEEGDVFLFYTDGLIEETNHKGEEFGNDRLRVALESYSQLDSQSLIAGILKNWQEFVGKNDKLTDDVTLIVLQVQA